jgi:hypothetical protein
MIISSKTKIKENLQFSFHVVHFFLLYVVRVIKTFLLDVFLIQVVLDRQALDVYVLVPKKQHVILSLCKSEYSVSLVFKTRRTGYL